jgi:hypothetical protein
VQGFTTISFAYDVREDRILAAVNAGRPDAWSCWLTRHVVLTLLGRAPELVAGTSPLARRAPAEFRGDFTAFEREAAIATTAQSMSKTPAEVLRSTAVKAELSDRVTIAKHGDGFRLELRGHDERGAVGLLTRAELQRVLEMLQGQVTNAGWTGTPTKSQVQPAVSVPDSKPKQH